MVSRRNIGRGHHGRLVRGRERLRTVSLSASLFGGRLIAVMKEDGSRANLEGEGTASTEMDGLEAMRLGS